MNSFLDSSIKLFEYHKELGERTFKQLSEEQLLWQVNEESNSIAMIVKHLSGNMLSRWTNFLSEDGEKTWRDREGEFESTISSRDELLNAWEEGWSCLLTTLKSLKNEDLDKVVYIRNQGHTVVEAVTRQLAHYPLHVGQILFIGKMLKGKEWQSPSIPKGGSAEFNKEKFSNEKGKKHFTDK